MKTRNRSIKSCGNAAKKSMSALRLRRSPAFWAKHPEPRHDLVRSMPETLPLGQRFETVADAERYREKNLGALIKIGGFQDVVDLIDACTPVAPCRQILCPVCARSYRRWLAGELLRITAGLRATVLTILLCEVPSEELRDVDADSLHERLRKRLLRAGVDAAVGGTEVKFDARRDVWIVHVHLLALEANEESIRTLRRTARKDGIKRAIMAQPLRDRIEQISYLQKFSTVHRPGATKRSVPLPSAQIGQLADWTRSRRFEEHLFLLGFRRRGGTIVREGET